MMAEFRRRIRAEGIKELACGTYPLAGEEGTGYTYAIVIEAGDDRRQWIKSRLINIVLTISPEEVGMFLDDTPCTIDDKKDADGAADQRQSRNHRPRRSDAVVGYRELVKASIKKGKCLPLLPRHQIYLWVHEGDGQRFAAMFRQTWGRVPLWARRRMLQYWKHIPFVPSVYLSPDIYHALSPHIKLSDETISESRRAFAGVSRTGHLLRFRPKRIAAMPDDVMQDLIAHELAHVLQGAAGIHCIDEYKDGRRLYAYRDGTMFGGNYEIERDADDMMNCWGFDSESIDQWCLATGRSKVRKIDISKPGEFAKYLKRVERNGR
jgi:hypothetical protein